MNKTRIANICSALTVMLITLYLFPRHATSFQYHAEAGKPWGYDALVADCDFPIYKTDRDLEAERTAALRSLTPCYQRDDHSTLNILSVTDYRNLEEQGISRIQVLRGLESTSISLKDVFTPKTAFENFGHEFVPTLHEDTAMTHRLRQSLLSGISLTQGMVQKGEKIIDRGKIVTERDIQILSSLKRTYAEQDLSLLQRLLATLGDGVLIFVYFMMFIIYLRVFRPRHLLRTEHVLFFCTLPATLIILSCLLINYTHLSIYLIPFAWVPVLTRIFFDSRTALFLHIVTVFTVSLVVTSPFEFLVVQTAVGMVTVASLRDLARRSQLFKTAFYILCTYFVVYTAFCLATTGEVDNLHLYTYLYFVLNIILVICSYGLIYFFERVFKVMSSITLVELTDLSNDLLQRFSLEAPGSFQHSMQVSNLATEAARVVGADTLLVRTGALYHDIGKMLHPEYFTENQQDGSNPLLTMPSEQAAKVIIAHVTDGLKLAQQHKLPERVADFISTHQGNSLVRYFYNTAVNNGENPNEEDFRYPGPRPQSREQAIVMMADAVEARSRTLKDVNEKSVRTMVKQMLDQQIADGQLDEAAITFSDMTQIKEVFVQHLLIMNHHRVKYPSIKK